MRKHYRDFLPFISSKKLIIKVQFLANPGELQNGKGPATRAFSQKKERYIYKGTI